jgi:hypothetical protein
MVQGISVARTTLPDHHDPPDHLARTPVHQSYETETKTLHKSLALFCFKTCIMATWICGTLTNIYEFASWLFRFHCSCANLLVLMAILRKNTEPEPSIPSHFWRDGMSSINCDSHQGHRMTAEESLSRVVDKAKYSSLAQSYGRNPGISHASHRIVDLPVTSWSDNVNTIHGSSSHSVVRPGHKTLTSHGRILTWMSAVITIMTLALITWKFLFIGFDWKDISCSSCYLDAWLVCQYSVCSFFDWTFWSATPLVFHGDTTSTG